MERNICLAFALRGDPRFAAGQLVVEKRSEKVNTLEVLLWRLALAQPSGDTGALFSGFVVEGTWHCDRATAAKSLAVRGMLNLSPQGQPSSSCLQDPHGLPVLFKCSPRPWALGLLLPAFLAFLPLGQSGP